MTLAEVLPVQLKEAQIDLETAIKFFEQQYDVSFGIKNIFKFTELECQRVFVKDFEIMLVIRSQWASVN